MKQIFSVAPRSLSHKPSLALPLAPRRVILFDLHLLQLPIASNKVDCTPLFIYLSLTLSLYLCSNELGDFWIKLPKVLLPPLPHTIAPTKLVSPSSFLSWWFTFLSRVIYLIISHLGQAMASLSPQLIFNGTITWLHFKF